MTRTQCSLNLDFEKMKFSLQRVDTGVQELSTGINASFGANAQFTTSIELHEVQAHMFLT